MVAHLTTSERHEVNEAISIALQVIIVVIAVASVLAWLAAGRVLAPLRLLTDTARSISNSHKEQIFERFARATNSQQCSEGAGLGLAIVSAIAAAHGGKVELFNRLGKGSTFTIVIPCKPLKEVRSSE